MSVWSVSNRKGRLTLVNSSGIVAVGVFIGCHHKILRPPKRKLLSATYREDIQTECQAELVMPVDKSQITH